VTLFLKSFASSLVSSLLTLPLTGVSVQWTVSSLCSIVIWNLFDCGFMCRSKIVPWAVLSIFKLLSRPSRARLG